jgi:aryl-alcohol dehydrogenase-like predicted oxidoreductase
MQALHDCVRSGKVRYIGASSMSAWQFAKAQRVAGERGWTPFVTMQNHYNLLYREEEREMIPQCLDLGVGVIPWSPLARGLLARARSATAGTPRGVSDIYTEELYSESNHEIIDTAEAIASERGISMAQVAMAWVMSRPGVTAPIVGATRLSHLEDAIGAVEIVLSEDEVTRLEEPYRPRSVAGH